MAEKPSWSSVGEFVTEGFVLAVPLCFPGQSQPPPADETAIQCMTLDPGGAVYCGTAGARGHVLSAMVRGDSGVVFDMGVAPEAASVDALAVVGEHVYAVVSGPRGAALWRWPRMVRSFLIQEWTLPRCPPEKVCDVLPAGRVADAAVVPDGRTLYTITEPAGELLRIDPAAGQVTVLAKVNEEGRFSRRIVMDSAGCLWGTRGMAMIWRCEPATGRIEDVAPVPAAAGRAQHTQASAWALDAVTGALYGGTAPDGYLFRLDARTGEVLPLGKPTRLEEVNCLTVGNDGRLFGAAGLAEDIGHLFCHEPARGTLRDLGIPVSTLAARQYGYHFRCALTGRDGEIYLGQHERASHLWLYFPPVVRRVAGAPAASGTAN
jgi:hypothetical protein